MRSFSFIVALMFAFVGFSAAFPQFHILEARKGGKNGTSSTKNNGTKSNSVNKQCNTMARLTKLTTLAANQTKLDAWIAKGKLNDTSVAALKTKAADAATKLATLTANTTLVGECAVVEAHQQTIGECKAIKKLAKLTALATNQTAMDALISKKQLNDTQITKFKDSITKAQTKLDTLNANITLTDICAAEVSQKDSTGSTAGKSSSQLFISEH